MAFPKIILTFPSEGFTGETVKHTITKANLTNQPELVKEGIKIGDVVDVVKPEAQTPIVGESAATKKTTTTKVKKIVDETLDVVIPEKGNPKRAKEIADAQSVDFVFENNKGEFFTSKNLVLLSVGQDKSKIITHSF